MAYIPNNLSVVSATIEGNWNTAVYIHPSDSLATVTGANYISDGQQRGLENGDIVWAILNNVAYLLQVSASQTLPSLGVTLSGVAGGVANGSLPPAQYSTAALQSTAMTAAQVAGAATTVFDNTGTTPGNLQMPTAANLIAAVPGWQIGQAYELRIRNDSGSANTATITTNTGITLTGTMTIAQNVTRYFIVTYTAAGAVTVQSVGVSAAAA